MHKTKISLDQCKDTGLAIILILLLCSLRNRSPILISAAIAMLILTMTAPKLIAPLARPWFAFSHYLGETISKVLLTVIFFAVVTPIAIVRKLCGKDAMILKQWRAGQQSIFVRRDHTFTPADLEKPF